MSRLPLTGAGPSAGGLPYSEKVLSYSPIAYWQLNEASGAAICSVDTNQNGTYSGVTLGQTGIGDGETCPLFDGTNDRVDVHSATFDGVFDDAVGSVLIWTKVFEAAVWTDGAERHMFSFFTDNNNFVGTHKLTNNNFIQHRYYAGGTPEAVNRTPFSPAGWVPYVITWDKTTDDIVKVYYSGANELTSATLGSWSGAMVTALLGAWTTSYGFWKGWIAHCAVWDSVLTTTQIAALAVV